MTPLFTKLNLKAGHNVLVIDAPAGFEAETDALIPKTPLTHQVKEGNHYDFILGFVTRQVEVDHLSVIFERYSQGDAILWVAYPKGSSKRYACEFNRDNGWTAMAAVGLEPVRIVAIDQDWSALRFRRVTHIQSMTRSFALTEAGRKKAQSAPKTPTETPDDLKALLREQAQAAAFFESLAPSHRREYIRWIEEAKRPETRENRLQKTLAMLLEGKKSVR